MRALVLLALAASACRPAAAPEDSRLRVAVSVPPQAYFVERIGGRHVKVDVMIPPGYSHVDYPLTPSQMAALSRSQVYVAVGHPAFELERAGILPFLKEMPGVRIVDMSHGMRLLEGSGEGGEEGHEDHGHEGGDPHVWVSPDTVAVAVRNIAALDREIRAELAGVRGGRFMVYHPTWGYFARRYGLQQVAIESEGKEPSAARLIRLIDEARREDVKVIFVQSGFPRKSAQVIAGAVGGRVLVADPQERNWMDNLRRVSRELSEALPHA